MKTLHTQKTAALNGAGNKQALVSSWIVFFEQPENRKLLNQLADQVDLELRRKFPSGILYDVLKNQEEEVRQQAAIMLFEHYLPGNFQLARATRSGDRDEIKNQIGRSINAATKIVQMRLSRELVSEMKRWSSLPEDAVQWGCIPHSSDHTLHSLPYHALRELALAALLAAVEQKRVSSQNAALATTIIEKGVTQAEVARRLKINRSAVHQRLQAVRKYLREEIKKTEFPTL